MYNYKTKQCERCGKEIKNIWKKKYCNACRKIVDDEIYKAKYEKEKLERENDKKRLKE